MEVATEEQRRKGQAPGEQALFPLGCAYHAWLQQRPDMSFSVPRSRLRDRSNLCPFCLVLLRFSLEMSFPATVQPVPAS